MSTSRRLQLLFLGALVGVAVCLGLVVQALLGPVAAVAYTALALVLLALGAARARAAQEADRAAARADELRAAGRSCTCCTTSQHDPVKVI